MCTKRTGRRHMQLEKPGSRRIVACILYDNGVACAAILWVSAFDKKIVAITSWRSEEFCVHAGTVPIGLSWNYGLSYAAPLSCVESLSFLCTFLWIKCTDSAINSRVRTISSGFRESSVGLCSVICGMAGATTLRIRQAWLYTCGRI